MDTQTITAQVRLSGWGEAVRERIASGQTVTAFCEENKISKTTYYYRQRKVREAVCAELMKAQSRESGLVPTGWVQVGRSADVELLTRATGSNPIAAESFLSIEAGRFHITVNAETDPELLARVCRVLGTL